LEEVLIHVLSDFKDCSHVTAAVAVIWRAEHRHNVLILHHIINQRQHKSFKILQGNVPVWCSYASDGRRNPSLYTFLKRKSTVGGGLVVVGNGGWLYTMIMQWSVHTCASDNT
jgi:hypothetical protein